MKIFKRILHFFSMILQYIMIGLIRFYQTAISPLTPPACRFTPTCSQYALEAIKKYGPLKEVGLH